MAKTTATIIGLVMAAVSIGVNTARFPIVWEMTGPASAAKPSDESPPVDPPKQPENDAPAVATQEETDRPAADDPPAEETAAAAENDATPSDDMPAPEDQPAAPRVTEEPLAPVSFAGLSGNARSETVQPETVRRLPPVDRFAPMPVVSSSNNGAIPVYPSTGM